MSLLLALMMIFSSMATTALAAEQGRKWFVLTGGDNNGNGHNYGNEGHDSANSEYADVGERLGGIEDFRSLIKIAHEYNTEVGIHVNAQEAYPESKSFNETMVGTLCGGFKFQQRPGTNNGIVYRYSYRILDDQGNVLASGSNISVADVNRSGGAWIVQKLEENVKAAKIEISILEGQGGFAAIAEIAPISVTKLGG